MKLIKITKIAQDLHVTHSAVSQWFSGTTLPKYKYMLEMSNTHNIPFTAWSDIKSFITDDYINNNTPKTTTKSIKGVA